MANLIPGTELKAQLSNMAARAVFGGAAAVACAGIFFALALVPAYFDAYTQLSARQAALTTLQSGQSGQNTDRDMVNKINKRVTALGNIGAQHITDALAALVTAHTKNIVLNSFSYTRKAGTATLVVSGVSSDSSSFKTFSEALKGKAPFDKVTVPLSSLADVSGLFSMTLSGTF